MKEGKENNNTTPVSFLTRLLYYSCGEWTKNKSNLITKRQAININDGLIYEPADEGVCVCASNLLSLSVPSSFAYRAE